jgi:hypothetical protein
MKIQLLIAALCFLGVMAAPPLEMPFRPAYVLLDVSLPHQSPLSISGMP